MMLAKYQRAGAATVLSLSGGVAAAYIPPTVDLPRALSDAQAIVVLATVARGPNPDHLRLTVQQRLTRADELPARLTMPVPGDMNGPVPGAWSEGTGIVVLRRLRDRYELVGGRAPLVDTVVHRDMASATGLPELARDTQQQRVETLLEATLAAPHAVICEAKAQAAGCSVGVVGQVKVNAFRALLDLARLGGAQWFARLARHPDSSVALFGHAGLARLGELPRIPAFESMITQPAPEHLAAVGQWALAVATSPATPERREAALVLLRSNQPAVRRDGALALRHAATETDLPLLRDLLDAPERDIR